MAVRALAAARPTEREERKIAALDRLLAHVPLHRALARSVEASLAAEYELPAPALDLACGDGTFAYATYDTPLTAGVDAERTMLRWATRHHAHRSLAVARGEALPFRDGAFASIICNSSLEHVREDEAVLAEANRVLAPGGTLLLTVPSEHFFPYLLGSSLARAVHIGPLASFYERWTAYVAKVHHAYPPDGWLARLTKAGFQARDSRYYFTAGSMQAMDAAQYISVPSFLTKWLLGRWVVWPNKGRWLPLARWLGRLAHEGGGKEGAFLLFHCEKVAALVSNSPSNDYGQRAVS